MHRAVAWLVQVQPARAGKDPTVGVQHKQEGWQSMSPHLQASRHLRELLLQLLCLLRALRQLSLSGLSNGQRLGEGRLVHSRLSSVLSRRCAGRGSGQGLLQAGALGFKGRYPA